MYIYTQIHLFLCVSDAHKRSLTFAAIAQTAHVALSDVEWLVMKALSLKLVKGVFVLHVHIHTDTFVLVCECRAPAQPHVRTYSTRRSCDLQRCRVAGHEGFVTEACQRCVCFTCTYTHRYICSCV